MDRVVLNRIPFHVDVAQLLKMLHLDDGEDADAARRLASEAEAIARPKALYKIAYITDRGDDYVVLDSTRLTSRVLRVNLDTTQRAFAYVATAGKELEQWADVREDILERYWADAIMLMAVRTAATYLTSYLKERYRTGNMSRMNPGSLQDWPLKEQRALFSLLGEVEESIGVQLTGSFLMIPRKSVSGIQFPVQESFESCQLCPRDNCSSRRAPYDPALYDRKFRLTGAEHA